MRRNSLVILTVFALVCIQCAQGNGSKRRGHTRSNPGGGTANPANLAANSRGGAVTNQGAHGAADNSGVQATGSEVRVSKTKGTKQVKASDVKESLGKLSEDMAANRINVEDLKAGTYTLKTVMTSFEVVDSSAQQFNQGDNGEIQPKGSAANYIEIEGFDVKVGLTGTKPRVDFIATQPVQMGGNLGSIRSALPTSKLNIESRFTVSDFSGKKSAIASSLFMLIHSFNGKTPITTPKDTPDLENGVVNQLSKATLGKLGYQNIWKMPNAHTVVLSQAGEDISLMIEIDEINPVAGTRRVFLTYAYDEKVPATSQIGNGKGLVKRTSGEPLDGEKEE